MRFHSAFCVAAALAVLTAACDEGGDDGTGVQQTARVRVVNASSATVGSLGVATGGTTIGSALTYGTAGTVCTTVPVTSGGNTFALTANGTSVGSLAGTLSPGREYTLVVTGTGATANAILLDNSATTPTTGTYGVRFVNATLNPGNVYATPVGTANLATSTTLSGGSNLGALGSTAFLPSATANTMFWLTSTSSPSTVFATTGSAGVTFPAAGTSTIVFLPQPTTGGSSFVQANGC
jgi:hypothetical protein